MKHVVIVLTEPTPGREDEFNDYYENTHIDEVLASAGWESGQRFRLVDQAGADCPLPYLAFYEVEASDSAEILQTLHATRPQRLQSSSLNKSTAGVWVFAPTGPRHERGDPVP